LKRVQLLLTSSNSFMPKTRLLLLLSVFGLAACSINAGGLGQQFNQFYANPVLLQQIPFYPQEDYQCGPAALATVLGASGVMIAPEQLVDAVFIPELGGSLQIEMMATARSHQRLVYQIKPQLNALLTQVNAGNPVLVLQNLGLSWMPQWHYAVVTGFNMEQEILFLNSGTIEGYQLKLSTFEKTWKRAENWGFILLQPGQVPEQADEYRYFESAATFENTADAAAANLVYKAGLQRWPDSRLIGAALGSSLYRSGNLDDAIALLENLLSIHPDFADGHNNLAFLLLQRGDHESARQHAELAITLGGNQNHIYQQTLQQINNAQ